MPSLALRLAPGVRIEFRPMIEGLEVVLRDALVVPGRTEALTFAANVDLPRLARLAPGFSQLPDLFENYNRIGPPVALPDFLTALSTLLARGILQPGGAGW